MTDEQRHGTALLGHPGGCRPYVRDIRREARLSKITARFADAGKIEPQDTNPPFGEAT